MNRYDELKQKHQKEYDKFAKGRIFYAFNAEQFEKGLKEINFDKTSGEKLVPIKIGSYATGAYIRKSHSSELNDLFMKQNKELEQAIENDPTGDGFIFDMFDSELSNHEYNYTYDPSDALSACGIDMKDLNANERLTHGFEKACQSQLKWAKNNK